MKQVVVIILFFAFFVFDVQAKVYVDNTDGTPKIQYTAPDNKLESEEWYYIASRNGDVSAQFIMGQMYEHGINVAKNKGEAFYWYEQAAKNGYVYAQYRLGEAYLKGDIVAKDTVKAKEWLEKASKSGDKASADLLAKIK